MKKLKLIILVIVLISSLFILSGCTSTYYKKKEAYKSNTSDRFIKIKTWSDEGGYANYLVYDKETKVQYWRICSQYNSGITVLLDAEGKPLLYEGD